MSGTVLHTGYIMVTKTDVLPDRVDSESSGRDEHLSRHTGCYASCYDTGTDAAVGRAPKSVWEDKGRLTETGYR